MKHVSLKGKLALVALFVLFAGLGAGMALASRAINNDPARKDLPAFWSRTHQENLANGRYGRRAW